MVYEVKTSKNRASQANSDNCSCLDTRKDTEQINNTSEKLFKAVNKDYSVSKQVKKKAYFFKKST